MKNNKGFLPIAILMATIAVLIAGSVYYATKTSNHSSQDAQENTTDSEIKQQVLNQDDSQSQTITQNQRPIVEPICLGAPILVYRPEVAVFQITGQITVVWDPCAVPESELMDIYVTDLNTSATTYLTTPTGTINDGKEIFPLPSFLVAGNNYRVTVCQKNNCTLIKNNSDFKVISGSLPSITIVSPNGGQTFKQGHPTISVQWTTSGIPSDAYMIVELIKQDGFRNYFLDDDTDPNSPRTINDGISTSTLERDVYPGVYKIRVRTNHFGGEAGQPVVDESDGIITITP